MSFTSASFFVQQFPLKQQQKTETYFSTRDHNKRNFPMCQWRLCWKHDLVEHQLRLVLPRGCRRCFRTGRKLRKGGENLFKRTKRNDLKATSDWSNTHERRNRCNLHERDSIYELFRWKLREEVLSRISEFLWWRSHLSWVTRTTHPPLSWQTQSIRLQ